MCELGIVLKTLFNGISKLRAVFEDLVQPDFLAQDSVEDPVQ
jgi:hypothetical protein